MSSMKQSWIERNVKIEWFATWQDFCDRLLTSIYPDYTTVRAWWRNGDMKNDWYCVIDRRYFQAHSTRWETSETTKNKINKDYDGLVAKWENVQEWVYIYNDPNIWEVENHIDTLRQKELGKRTITAWGPLRISEEIMKLPNEKIEYILWVRLPWEEDELSDDIFYEITKYIRKKRTEATLEDNWSNISLIDKIHLNFDEIEEADVLKMIKRAYSDVISVKMYMESMGKEINSDIWILITLMECEYKIIKDTQDLQSKIEDSTIFMTISHAIVPSDKLSTSIYYQRAWLAMVLYIFELCYFGKKSEYDQLNLFPW